MAPKKRAAAPTNIADRLRDVEARLDHLELSFQDLAPETSERTLDNIRRLEAAIIERSNQQMERNRR